MSSQAKVASVWTTQLISPSHSQTWLLQQLLIPITSIELWLPDEPLHAGTVSVFSIGHAVSESTATQHSTYAPEAVSGVRLQPYRTGGPRRTGPSAEEHIASPAQLSEWTANSSPLSVTPQRASLKPPHALGLGSSIAHSVPKFTVVVPPTAGSVDSFAVYPTAACPAGGGGPIPPQSVAIDAPVLVGTGASLPAASSLPPVRTAMSVMTMTMSAAPPT